MRASGVARLVVAMTVVGGMGCSIWAALSDPYKAEGPSVSDAATDAASREAGPTRVMPGFFPYAIAVHDDTLYVVDQAASVHVAFDASTSFSTFWRGDGGEFFYPHINGIAASGAGVFWTVVGGVHFCASDGGDCGFLSLSNAPGLIAAGDTLMAWIDSAGVQICTPSVRACVPTTLPGSKGAALLAVWPNGTVAWADGGPIVHIGPNVVALGETGLAPIAAMGIDDSSGTLYWASEFNLGSVEEDGGHSLVAYLGSQSYKPDQLFVERDTIYWSLRNGPSSLYYCHVHSDAGCPAKNPLGSTVSGATSNYGIAATSRNVLAIVSSTDNTPPMPMLIVWPLPR